MNLILSLAATTVAPTIVIIKNADFINMAYFVYLRDPTKKNIIDRCECHINIQFIGKTIKQFCLLAFVDNLLIDLLILYYYNRFYYHFTKWKITNQIILSISSVFK